MTITLRPIGITISPEGHIALMDGQAGEEFRNFVREYDFDPSELRAICCAVAGEGGVNIVQLIELFMNAAVSRASAAADQTRRFIPCTYQPGCNRQAGHADECDLDLDVPF